MADTSQNILVLREDLGVDDYAADEEFPLAIVTPLSEESLPRFFNLQWFGISPSTVVTYYARVDCFRWGLPHERPANSFTVLDYSYHNKPPPIHGPIYVVISGDDSKFSQTRLIRHHFGGAVAKALSFMRNFPLLKVLVGPITKGYCYSLDLHMVTTKRSGDIVLFTDGHLLFSRRDIYQSRRFVETIRQIGLLDRDLVPTLARLFSFLMLRNAYFTDESLDAFILLRDEDRSMRTRLKALLHRCLDTKSPQPPRFFASAELAAAEDGLFFISQPVAIDNLGSLTIKY